MNTSVSFQYPAAEAGLTEQLVRNVVILFYDKIRRDPVLGPLFTEALGADWDAHIERITLFWLSATRLRRGYDGRNFMPAHLQHQSIQVDQIPRWLALFQETVVDQCSPQGASALMTIAERMAESLALGLGRRTRR